MEYQHSPSQPSSVAGESSNHKCNNIWHTTLNKRLNEAYRDLDEAYSQINDLKEDLQKQQNLSSKLLMMLQKQKELACNDEEREEDFVEMKRQYSDRGTHADEGSKNSEKISDNDLEDSQAEEDFYRDKYEATKIALHKRSKQYENLRKSFNEIRFDLFLSQQRNQDLSENITALEAELQNLKCFEEASLHPGRFRFNISDDDPIFSPRIIGSEIKGRNDKKMLSIQHECKMAESQNLLRSIDDCLKKPTVKMQKVGYQDVDLPPIQIPFIYSFRYRSALLEQQRESFIRDEKERIFKEKISRMSDINMTLNEAYEILQNDFAEMKKCLKQAYIFLEASTKWTPSRLTPRRLTPRSPSRPSSQFVSPLIKTPEDDKVRDRRIVELPHLKEREHQSPSPRKIRSLSVRVVQSGQNGSPRVWAGITPFQDNKWTGKDLLKVPPSKPGPPSPRLLNSENLPTIKVTDGALTDKKLERKNQVLRGQARNRSVSESSAKGRNGIRF